MEEIRKRAVDRVQADESPEVVIKALGSVRTIKEKFGIKLSESSVGRLLRQLGFSNQKPLDRAFDAHQKNSADVQQLTIQ